MAEPVNVTTSPTGTTYITVFEPSTGVYRNIQNVSGAQTPGGYVTLGSALSALGYSPQPQPQAQPQPQSQPQTQEQKKVSEQYVAQKEEALKQKIGVEQTGLEYAQNKGITPTTIRFLAEKGISPSDISRKAQQEYVDIAAFYQKSLPKTESEPKQDDFSKNASTAAGIFGISSESISEVLVLDNGKVVGANTKEGKMLRTPEALATGVSTSEGEVFITTTKTINPSGILSNFGVCQKTSYDDSLSGIKEWIAEQPKLSPEVGVIAVNAAASGLPISLEGMRSFASQERTQAFETSLMQSKIDVNIGGKYFGARLGYKGATTFDLEGASKTKVPLAYEGAVAGNIAFGAWGTAIDIPVQIGKGLLNPKPDIRNLEVAKAIVPGAAIMAGSIVAGPIALAKGQPGGLGMTVGTAVAFTGPGALIKSIKMLNTKPVKVYNKEFAGQVLEDYSTYVDISGTKQVVGTGKAQVSVLKGPPPYDVVVETGYSGLKAQIGRSAKGTLVYKFEEGGYALRTVKGQIDLGVGRTDIGPVSEVIGGAQTKSISVPVVRGVSYKGEIPTSPAVPVKGQVISQAFSNIEGRTLYNFEFVKGTGLKSSVKMPARLNILDDITITGKVSKGVDIPKNYKMIEAGNILGEKFYTRSYDISWSDLKFEYAEPRYVPKDLGMPKRGGPFSSEIDVPGFGGKTTTTKQGGLIGKITSLEEKVNRMPGDIIRNYQKSKIPKPTGETRTQTTTVFQESVLSKAVGGRVQQAVKQVQLPKETTSTGNLKVMAIPISREVSQTIERARTMSFTQPRPTSKLSMVEFVTPSFETKTTSRARTVTIEEPSTQTTPRQIFGIGIKGIETPKIGTGLKSVLETNVKTDVKAQVGTQTKTQTQTKVNVGTALRLITSTVIAPNPKPLTSIKSNIIKPPLIWNFPKFSGFSYPKDSGKRLKFRKFGFKEKLQPLLTYGEKSMLEMRRQKPVSSIIPSTKRTRAIYAKNILSGMTKSGFVKGGRIVLPGSKPKRRRKR